jgi:hypothetical protein
MIETNNINTTNKSNRELGNKFNIKDFNSKFNDNEQNIHKDNIININLNNKDETIVYKLPHKRPVEDIIISIRELFYIVLEMLLNKQNPIPFIFSTPDRHFAFAILLIINGTLLLLFSTLMMSSNDTK